MNSRVLMIDQSPAMHRLVDVVLGPLNIEFHATAIESEGLALARSIRPDVIILDLNFGESSGIELCRQIKREAAISSTPVVIVSSESRVEEKVRALESGASDFISKPFNHAELRARIRVALRTKYLIDLLSDRARIDGLTGVHNRALFDERLESELSIARRYGGDLSCIMMDIDHFKKVNDNYGHIIGDEVLRHVASTLTRRCRREDIVCRYGGEEFAILTPNVNLNGAITLAEDLRQLIASIELRPSGSPLSITCSFGVADYSAAEAMSLSQRADEALYYAKRNGRNRVCPELRHRVGATSAI